MRNPSTRDLMDGIVSAIGFLSELDFEAGAEIHRQAGVTEGRDVLSVHQVFGLAVDAQPGKELIASAQIELGVTVVEIAVGQQHVPPKFGVSQIGRIVAAAGKGGGEQSQRMVCAYVAVKKPVCGGRRNGRAPTRGE